MSLHKLIGPLFSMAMVAGLAQTSQSSYSCEMAPAVRQALNSLPSDWDPRTPLEERMKPVRALLEKYPRDLFVQQRYQDKFRRQTNLYQEFDAAFALYRARPNDPIFRYVEARLTASFHRAKAEEMLSDLIARQPDFPWPHLAIAEMTDGPGARDAKKAEPHLRAFLAACPSSVEGYALLRTAEDPEMIRDGAAKLRPLLEAQGDNVSLPYWRYLWDLEFRAAPKEQQETVRQRVLKDAESLKKLPPAPSREWFQILDYAANLTNDQDLRSWLEETVLQKFPGSWIAVSVERVRWSREHPRPGPKAKPEEQRAYADLSRALQEELAKRYPDDSSVILDRWVEALRGGASRPLEERLAIADAFSSMMRRSPDAGSSNPPLPIGLADLYVKWRVRLDQVPGLIQAGFQQAELEQKYARDPSMFPAEIRDLRPDPLALTYWQAYRILADLYLYQQNADRARDAIQIGLANADQRPVFSLAISRGKIDADSRRRDWLPLQARLAVLEGNSQAALSLFRQYLSGLSKDVLTGASQGQIDTQNLVAEVKKLYLAGGGQEESWLEWVTSAPKAGSAGTGPAPLEYKAVLPDFQAKDLSGRTWRPADLRGRATYIDIWATWCGPCRAEHPQLQKLYEKVKGSKDIQVLTFSADVAAYLAESYMKEQGYTFPVIVSKDLREKLFPVAGLPQGWIIDARGRRSSPFRMPSVERAIQELEKAAAAK